MKAAHNKAAPADAPMARAAERQRSAAALHKCRK